MSHVVLLLSLCSDELKKDKFGIAICVKNATVTRDGDVEASVNIQSKKTKHMMVFVLENHSDATVQMCHCDVLLRPYGFKRSQIENEGKIEPG